MLLRCAVFAVFLLQQETNSEAVTDGNSVTFYLFNRANLKKFIRLTDEVSLKEVDSKKPIFLLIHGWTESRNKTWYEDLKNAFLEKLDVNVVQIDYSKPASKRYPVAVLSSKSIAQIIAKFILQIPNVDLKNVTIIGHSLGGQIAGFVGKQIFATTNKKIGKIIALDPAGPLFTLRSEYNRLAPKNAAIVEAIHTDRTMGFYKNIGHIDFYVNPNRATQPGCENLDFLKAAFCSHHRSYELFINAIQNGGFLGTLCESEIKFTQGSCEGGVMLPLFFESFNKTGAYFLETEKSMSNEENFKQTDFAVIEELYN